MIYKSFTLPATKIAPENGWLGDEISFSEGIFLGALAVSFKERYLEDNPI